MRHWWIYIILYVLVGLFGLSPFSGTDIAKLSPVEAVWLEAGEGYVRMETSCRAVGTGETVAKALEDLKQTASTVVFLDTADYVIIKKGSEALVEQVQEFLRPSCRVCCAVTKPDIEKAVAFLTIHEPSVTLKNVHRLRLPVLTEQEGRLILIEENSNPPAECMAGGGSQCTAAEPGRAAWLAFGCS